MPTMAANTILTAETIVGGRGTQANAPAMRENP
jgi:hypothetical protein